MEDLMRAVVVDAPGGPGVLRLTRVPRPSARPGWVVVEVGGFGLNRSEMFTRQGHSPSVRFPRVLGIECVGTVVESAEPHLPAGTVVAACTDEMGRAYDGSYAEYVALPAPQVMPVRTGLDRATFAAVPETFLTAHGSLRALGLAPGARLVVRGASSALGLAAVALARDAGLRVAGTTRRADRCAGLRRLGVPDVLVDGGELGGPVRELWPQGADGVLDLVGGVSVVDSLRALAPGGIVCDAGILSGTWTIPAFEPLTAIPSGAGLTAYSSTTVTAANSTEVLQELVDGVAAGRYAPVVDRVLALADIPRAHRLMEGSGALGKLVVLPGTA